MLTVEDVWKYSLPDRTEVVGGEAGLAHQVKWVLRMSSCPPGFKGLKQGDIAIISTQALQILDPAMTLAGLAGKLVGKGLAGLIIQGEVTPEAMSVADREMVPLLVLPEGSDLTEVEQAVRSLILERRMNVYRRGQEIATELNELAINGKGVHCILKKLSLILGKTVVLEDDELRAEQLILANDWTINESLVRELLEVGRKEVLAWARQSAPSSSGPPSRRVSLPDAGISRIVAPVSVKGQVWNFVSVVGRDDDLSEEDKLAVSRAASACAIDIARDIAVLAAEDRVQGDFVQDLLTGNLADSHSQAFVARAKRLGYTLTPPYVVVAIEISSGTLLLQELLFEEGETLASRIERASAASQHERIIMRIEGNLLVLLLPTEENADAAQIKRMVEAVRSQLSAELKGFTLSLGVGRVYPGVEGVRTSYQESWQALAMGKQIGGEGHTSYFGDLGVYRLLFNLHDSPDLLTFYRETLGKLEEYDRKNAAELTKTLHVYFASCGSLTDAAQRLHLHRNTLLYRLHRVKEISCLDLEDAEQRLALQLALRIGEILRASSEHSS